MIHGLLIVINGSNYELQNPPLIVVFPIAQWQWKGYEIGNPPFWGQIKLAAPIKLTWNPTKKNINIKFQESSLRLRL